MTYAMLEEKLKYMPEECLEKMMEYADFVLYQYEKKQQSLIEEEQSEKGNLAEFFGTMDLGDGLELQKRWRDEWN